MKNDLKRQKRLKRLNHKRRMTKAEAEKKESSIGTWIVLSCLLWLLVVIIISGIVPRNKLFSEKPKEVVITREKANICIGEFNKKDSLPEDLNEYWSLPTSGWKTVTLEHLQQDMENGFKYSNKQLATTNAQYNKLEQLVSCLFNK